jgi:L-iditol 2-dehydrogenase
MRGVVFRGHRKIDVLTFDDPTPGPGEAIIEIKASGFCGSDLHVYRGSPDEVLQSQGFKDFASRGIGDDDPIIAGHEPCGVIAALGAGVNQRAFRVGDRVIVFHYDGCHYCDHCRTGWPQMCDDGGTVYGMTAHGGHAHYMKVPVSSLVHLPEEISFAGGAAIACGTGTAYGALVRLNLNGRDTLAVFGLGPVGLSAVQLAAAMGVKVIAVDIASNRLDRAREFGATHVIDSSKTDPVQEIRALTDGKGVSCSMDCSGADKARQAAVRSAAPWGNIALVGVGGTVTLDVMKDVIYKQRTIIGSYTFSEVTMAECARFIADHGVDIDAQFTDRWGIEEAEHAYREFDKQTSGKAVFEF